MEKSFEQHPFLPSGEWEGFYLKNHDRINLKMDLELDFKHPAISGQGNDEHGYFTIKGSFSLDTFKIQFDKVYSCHTDNYKGDIDEIGIWGVWERIFNDPDISPLGIKLLINRYTGGFHIWPKKKASESESESSKEENKKYTKKEMTLDVI